jgi:hypothetical protein
MSAPTSPANRRSSRARSAGATALHAAAALAARVIAASACSASASWTDSTIFSVAGLITSYVVIAPSIAHGPR